MKASYLLPTGTYNIFITRDELERLSNGKVIRSMPYMDEPCVVNRFVYDHDKNEMRGLDPKEVPNYLMFRLDEDVADIEAGLCRIQYLNIRLMDE